MEETNVVQEALGGGEEQTAPATVIDKRTLSVPWQTWVRAIALAVSTLNALAVMLFGFDPLPWTEEQVYAAISGLVEVALIVWAWWKNNSITKAALLADKVMQTEKAMQKLNG